MIKINKTEVEVPRKGSEPVKISRWNDGTHLIKLTCSVYHSTNWSGPRMQAANILPFNQHADFRQQLTAAPLDTGENVWESSFGWLIQHLLVSSSSYKLQFLLPAILVADQHVRLLLAGDIRGM